VEAAYESSTKKTMENPVKNGLPRMQPTL